MEGCKQFSEQLSFYLDDELYGNDRIAFEAHLERCPACRGELKREQGFLDAIREARPLYQPPASLRARIEPIIAESSPERSAASEVMRAQRQSVLSPSFGAKITEKKALKYRWMALVAMIILALGAETIYLTRHKDAFPSNRTSEFALLAVDTHLRHLRGVLPLEIVTSSPELISGWFSGKVPFGLKLPNYQESSGQEKIYELEGARLVGFKKDYAAYVAYQMHQRPITLVVTSNSVALPSGGEQLISKGITFHYDSIDGLKVITWSDLGLTYALVSDLEARGQQSCPDLSRRDQGS